MRSIFVSLRQRRFCRMTSTVRKILSINSVRVLESGVDLWSTFHVAILPETETEKQILRDLSSY